MNFDKITEKEIIDIICYTAKSLKANYNRRSKLVENEAKSGLVSRAKGTTMVANSFKATKSYFQDIEYLKQLINKL